MNTITRPTTGTYTVEEYDRMIEDGKIGEHDQVELIEGQIVAKMAQEASAQIGSGEDQTCRSSCVLPAGWHVRIERTDPIPQQTERARARCVGGSGRTSRITTMRPAILGRLRRPGRRGVPGRACMRTEPWATDSMGPAALPAYWIVKLAQSSARSLHGAHARRVGRPAYPPPTILNASASVELVLDGVAVATIAVADLLPRRAVNGGLEQLSG